MTVAAARSAAVLCALRRAAGGRRALQVVLFLGGLLTLGLLYGGQAHASESSEPPVSADARVSTDAGPDADASVTPSSRPAPAKELRRVARDSADSVRTVTQPVTETVRHVRPLAEGLTGPLIDALPAPLPTPLPTPPAPPGGDADQGGTPQPSVDLPVANPADLPTATSSITGVGLADSGSAALAATWSSSPYGGAVDHQSAVARHAPTTAPTPAPAPLPGKPCDSTPGALQQSNETHTPRAGDQHAATSAYGTRFALVPGAGSAAAEAPIRERPRDILEFPG
ncbi:hypothetical protein [Streptomyces lunaelactis]|uniref:hypothetical protein n=1 Tax=Streptomyces lunaelactis TaxID=1535768 RepID=UPI00131EED37|nr:hypothetical protein [Streptomyces lunaelactis]NUK88673.1 hypothetical protein [Streptomyces lunaelactis]